jgi:5-methylcytosine-specific restriction endonuclease McrA
MENRNKKIFKLYKTGSTMEEIGKIFNFSRSRAQQIIIKEVKKDILEKVKIGKLSAEDKILLDIAAKDEIREIALDRKNREDNEIKGRIQNKLDQLPTHLTFTTVSALAKAIGEREATIKEYFPDIAEKIINHRKKLWSRYYNKCRICGTVSIKHRSNGLCEKCYPKSDHFKEMSESSRLRNKAKWAKREREYAKAYAKRPEVIAKSKLKIDFLNYGGNREKALARDGYKCQKCGLTQEQSLKVLGRDLYVNRIGDTKDNRLENLVTVCRDCHQKRLVKKLHPFR